MIYTKANLEVVRAASTDVTRSALNGIYLEKDGSTVATNGNSLYIVGPSKINDDDFPQIDGNKPSSDPNGETIPNETIKALLKALPKRSTLPILTTTQLVGENGKKAFVVTDLENAQTINFRPGDGPYPKWKSCLPDEKSRPVFEISLGAKVLAELAAFVKATTSNKLTYKIDFKFYGPNVAATFEAGTTEQDQKISGLIMPMRNMD